MGSEEKKSFNFNGTLYIPGQLPCSLNLNHPRQGQGLKLYNQIRCALKTFYFA